MKIIIYENSHHETLPAIIELAHSASKNVVVFLDETTYQNLGTRESPEIQWPNTRFVCRQAQIKHRVFIKYLFDFAKREGFTHLHLNILSNNYLFFVINLIRLPKLMVSMTVHNINDYRLFSFRNLRDITESTAKIYLHRKLHRYRVLVPAMVAEMQVFFPNKKIVFIPAVFFDSNSSFSSGDSPLNIVVPGTVEEKRRDYDFVVNFMQNWTNGILPGQKIKLILLGNAGSPYAREIVFKLNALVNNELEIVTYAEEVKKDEYIKQMTNAKIIWCPLRVRTVGHRGLKETYNITKSPGINGDLVQFKKVALVPSELSVPKYLEHSMIKYNDEDELKGLMINLLAGDGLQLSELINIDLSMVVAEKFEAAFRILIN